MTKRCCLKPDPEIEGGYYWESCRNPHKVSSVVNSDGPLFTSLILTNADGKDRENWVRGNQELCAIFATYP